MNHSRKLKKVSYTFHDHDSVGVLNREKTKLLHIFIYIKFNILEYFPNRLQRFCTWKKFRMLGVTL